MFWIVDDMLILSCQNRVRKAVFTKEIASKKCFDFNSFFWITQRIRFRRRSHSRAFHEICKNCNFDQSFQHAEITNILETHKINSFCLSNFRERVCTKHANTKHIMFSQTFFREGICHKVTILWRNTQAKQDSLDRFTKGICSKSKNLLKNIENEQLGKRNRRFKIKSKNCLLKQKRFEKLLCFWTKTCFFTKIPNIFVGRSPSQKVVPVHQNAMSQRVSFFAWFLDLRRYAWLNHGFWGKNTPLPLGNFVYGEFGGVCKSPYMHKFFCCLRVRGYQKNVCETVCESLGPWKVWRQSRAASARSVRAPLRC